MADAVLGANLYPSIHDPDSGLLLAGGEISFFAPDQVTPKDVYNDPQRTSTYSNPLILDSVGQQPPIYYDTDEPYWIEIRRSQDPGCPCQAGELLYSFNFYPGDSTSDSIFADNFVSNGQFSLPISFNTPNQVDGQIDTTHTYVAQGWEFTTDNPDQNEVFVNFIPLFDKDDIDGNPKNYFNLQVNSVPSLMTRLDLFQTIGYVNALQGEDVTLSLRGFSSVGTSESIEVIIENIYDTNTTVTTAVGLIVLTSSEDTQSLNFTFPNVTPNSTDVVNNKTNLILRFPLSTIQNVSITNVHLEKGTVSSPSFIETPRDETSSRAFFNHYVSPESDTDFAGASQYQRLTYINNQFSWLIHTGTYKLVTVGKVPTDMEVCSGQTVNIDDYSPQGIPYRRLFDVIGNTFGGNDSSVVAVANGDTVTVGPPSGGKENAPFASGTLGTLITIAKTMEGFRLETQVTFSASSPTSVIMTNIQPGVMNPSPSDPSLCFSGPYGFWWGGEAPATINTTTLAANSTQVDFLSPNINAYQTSSYPNFGEISPVRFFEFSSLNPVDLNRGDYDDVTDPVSPMSYNVIRFSVDGSFGPDVENIQGQVTVDVDFSSSKSLVENLDIFAKTVNNGYEYQIKINSSLTSSAGGYFLYSSVDTNYYGWIRVDGAGMDPSIPGLIGVPIDILNTDDIPTQAVKIAQSISTSTFNFPDQTDFPTVPSANLVYAVYL